MKRKNLYTNILNVVALILAITWFILQVNVPYIDEIRILWSGMIATCSIDVFLTIVAIINIIVGIKNRKQSKPCLVLYEIIAFLYIVEYVIVTGSLLDLIYIDNVEFIIIAIYALTCILAIVQFILNRKVQKPENKKKTEIITFLVIVIIGIMSTFSPLMVKKSVENKIKKAMQEASGTISDARFIGKLADENKFNFLRDDGTVVFTVEAESLDDYQIIRDGNKKMMITTVVQNGQNKLLDISDGNNIRTILTYNIVGNNNISNFACLSGLDSTIYTSDMYAPDNSDDSKDSEEESIQRLMKVYDEEEKDFSKYEEPIIFQNSEVQESLSNMQSTETRKKYTYYSNENLAVQIVKTTGGGSALEEQNENQTQQVEYYLINLKNDQKIQIPCDKLLYEDEVNYKDEYLLFLREKYLIYSHEDKNGYINVETGETLELPSGYIFLDIQDTIAVVARVDEEDKGKKAYSDYEEAEYDMDEYLQDDGQVEILIVDKNLSILSKVYQSIYIYNDFYILDPAKKEGAVIGNNGEVWVSNVYVNEVLSEGIITIKDEEGKYKIYNENGKSNESYDEIYVKYAGGLSRGYEPMNGFDIYEDIVSQMYGNIQ